MGSFDPDNEADLRAIELDNNLSADSLALAQWLKHPDRHHSTQSVASLKISCNDPDTANSLIRGRIFIGGRQVVIRKDIREPIRCNRCQKYGHFQANCWEPEACANYAASSHSLDACTSSLSRCVSCRVNSTHASTDQSCPTFAKHCSDFDAHFPENRMPYYPTNDPLSWMTAPPKIATSTKSPAKPMMPPPLPPPETAAQPQWEDPAPPMPQEPRHTSTGSRILSCISNLDEYGFTSQNGTQHPRLKTAGQNQSARK